MFSGLFSKRTTNDDTEISYDDLADALKRGACLVVDVREPPEFASGHVPGAINQPLSRFDPKKLPEGIPVGPSVRRAADRRRHSVRRDPLDATTFAIMRAERRMAAGRRRHRSLAAFTWGTAAAPGDPSGSVIRFVLRPWQERLALAGSETSLGDERSARRTDHGAGAPGDHRSTKPFFSEFATSLRFWDLAALNLIFDDIRASLPEWLEKLV